MNDRTKLKDHRSKTYKYACLSNNDGKSPSKYSTSAKHQRLVRGSVRLGHHHSRRRASTSYGNEQPSTATNSAGQVTSSQYACEISVYEVHAHKTYTP